MVARLADVDVRLVVRARVVGYGAEVLLGLVSLMWGALLFRNGERERGLGVIAGWLAGLAIFVIVVRSAQ